MFIAGIGIGGSAVAVAIAWVVKTFKLSPERATPPASAPMPTTAPAWFMEESRLTRHDIRNALTALEATLVDMDRDRHQEVMRRFDEIRALLDRRPR